jgi:hypothetical protein
MRVLAECQNGWLRVDREGVIGLVPKSFMKLEPKSPSLSSSPSTTSTLQTPPSTPQQVCSFFSLYFELRLQLALTFVELHCIQDCYFTT